MSTPTRRHFLGGAALVGMGALTAAGCSPATPIHGEQGLTDPTADLTPDQAMAKLIEGNARFVELRHNDTNLSSARLVAVSKGQQPFVGVLGCVDSRVPPELVFDRGLGDLFDARIAGAIADDAAIGSLEFGVEEFGVPLLVVLGHTRCGAVTAAVTALRSGQTRAPGRIGAVVDPILPAVMAVQARGVTGDAVINAAAKEVVHRGVDALRISPILKDRLAGGQLKITGAFYDLDTGKVEFLT
ncbi:MAG: carbonic anhydrase [Mycobacterium sp.]